MNLRGNINVRDGELAWERWPAIRFAELTKLRVGVEAQNIIYNIHILLPYTSYTAQT